jgi:hypothetical protein
LRRKEKGKKGDIETLIDTKRSGGENIIGAGEREGWSISG